MANRRAIKLPLARKAPAARIPVSRPPLARMLRIHDALQGGRLPNCSGLGQKLEVCPKTIQRDIEFMRDQMDLPIEYDAERHGFYYSREVAAFPTVQVTEGELVALAVAQRALEQYRGTPFERSLEAAFQKLTAGLSDKISFSWTHVEGSVSFRQSGTTVPDLRLFEKLGEAVFRSREIEFDYLKPRAEAPERRRVQPYHLACIDGQWYLFGHDLVRGEMRTFALTRVRALKVLAKPFLRPLGFSIETLLAASFGVFHGGKPQAVRLRFTRAVARLVSERRWHASQKVEASQNGGCELLMRVMDSPELRRWILSWGAEVEVLAPVALRAHVRATAGAVLRIYG
ncbi:MAG TPA: WYL domain-containing protein [Verrucomicrobiae bacterium]|nr:WYL domain-containing protein [Verrucomicrobiae bacterium]